MAASLDDAMRRLEGALGLLEAAVTRRLEAERRRGDLETELQVMQDDRARLTLERESAPARLGRVENATEHLGRRIQTAIGAVESVLAAQDRGA